MAPTPASAASPLEEFVRDYLETAGGAWDEVEPQVYDVLLPDAGPVGGMQRIAFDPEALPEHPGAQLASFGTPFINHLLHDAVERGRAARFYLVGLNLAPHDLTATVRRALVLAPHLTWQTEHVRALHFPQAVFWFQAEFVSDQKEQEILPVAMDLHYRREVRHLERLFDRSRLSDTPSQPLAEARHAGLAGAYALARDQVLRSLGTLASIRNRDLSERLERQVKRMTRYYADLRGELENSARRGRDEEAEVRMAARRQAIDREEQVRIAELRQKNTLRVQLRLLQLLVIEQPKLLVRGRVLTERFAAPLELVWDPLIEAVEAPPCPACGRPGYAFAFTRQGRLVCPACSPTEQPKKGSR
jgi:hypothetical protein